MTLETLVAPREASDGGSHIRADGGAAVEIDGVLVEQAEQPWLVKSSTTIGPVAALLRPPCNVAATPAIDSRAKVLRDMSNGLMATI